MSCLFYKHLTYCTAATDKLCKVRQQRYESGLLVFWGWESRIGSGGVLIPVFPQRARIREGFQRSATRSSRTVFHKFSNPNALTERSQLSNLKCFNSSMWFLTRQDFTEEMKDWSLLRAELQKRHKHTAALIGQHHGQTSGQGILRQFHMRRSRDI